ncbi:MAG: antitoxin YezG family protein [Acetatifactor sp.]|nr:antitoxin YezG family protein [Acetatifactor sp.]
MINEIIYQNIYDEIEKFLLPEWDRLVIYLEYGEASYSFSFYVRSNGNYTKCYDLPQVSEENLTRSFETIDALLEKERSNNKESWSNMTIVIEKPNNMHADFDYSDLSEGTYQYKKDWKKKYLV